MSGGGTPKAPDVSGNTDAANAMAKTATDSAAQTMNTAKAYNQNAQDTLKSVNGAAGAMTNTVNQSATSNLNTYGNTFQPLQQQQADEAKNYTSDENVKKLQGMAVADQNSALQSSLANQKASLASEGVDPASVHGGSLAAQAQVQGAGANANAANQSYLNTQATGRQLVAGANQLGMQVDQAGMAGAGQGSQMGAQQVQNQNQTNSAGINNMTASNTFLNTGVGANRSAADITHQGFQDTMAAQQAAAANGPMAQIGTLAGTAMKAYTGGMMKGGPVPAGIPMSHRLHYQAGPNYPAAGPPPAFVPVPPPGFAQGSVVADYAVGGPVSNRGALPVPPVPGTTDTKPALLTPGEFVIPHDVAAFKGHEHWYKQMDKAREDMAMRQGVPAPPTSAWTATGH